MMERITLWMEKHFVPIAVKIGSQKHLVAIRDAFISILPVTMAGAIATMINALVRDLPAKFELQGITDAFAWLIGINGFIWWGTLAMVALVFSFAIGYQLAKAYDVDPLPAGLISLVAFIIVTPQVAAFGAEIDGVVTEVVGWGFLSWGYLNATGLFTAMIVGFIAAITYAKLMNANIKIKMPEEVPTGVSKAFESIIPGVLALYLVGTLAYLTSTFLDTSIADLIMTYIQMPFLSMSQGLGSVIVVTVMVSVFWFFGIHGTNVLAPVLDGVYLTATRANTAAHEAGTALEYIWTRGSFDAYAWMGGAGCTIGLIAALLIFSKKEEEKVIARLSAPMGIFNINEPIVFGLPIVLNPLYVIPWVLVPTLLVIIAYAVTAAGLVPPVFIEVPWVIPPVLYAWMATGFSFPAALLALFNLVLGSGIWAVFVLVSNKVEYK